MARLSGDTVTRIKQEVALERVVAHSGVKLKRHSQNNLMGHCPFHDDKTPSLWSIPARTCGTVWAPASAVVR